MRWLAYTEIHPAIGLAGVGDHPAAYFIGPILALSILRDTKHERWSKSRHHPS